MPYTTEEVDFLRVSEKIARVIFYEAEITDIINLIGAPVIS